jgi:RNA polymerase sigma-70 factor (ECF subfamily)
MPEAWKASASAAMARYACGDEKAFATLYDLLAPRLFAFLLRRTRNTSLAEDLLQQTFLQIHSARRNFSRGAEVTPWAYAIARHLLVDALRRDAREVLAKQNETEHARRDSTPREASPDAIVSRRRLARRIDDELGRLPEAHRVAFELVQRDGLSMAETAQVLGTSVATVKLRAFRTYEALRAALGAQVHEEFEASTELFTG